MYHKTVTMFFYAYCPLDAKVYLLFSYAVRGVLHVLRPVYVTAHMYMHKMTLQRLHCLSSLLLKSISKVNQRIVDQLLP